MIIGFTGGIAVGKSFVANYFKKFGAAIFDADSVVHQLYKEDTRLISYAEENFPEAVVNNEIDRIALSKYFLAHDENWIKFQSLVHSIVSHKLELFIDKEKNDNKKLLVLDIPLLLEAKLDSYCDLIIFVHADDAVQQRRLSERNIDKEKLDLILNTQLSIEKKRERSNFTIDTSVSKEHVLSQVKEIVNMLT
ncbi:dephospho-CoA kinase [Wolbachia endosymbiont of Ctenocephalides felis wCfeT]|uniref:dephospho-CoA kinase n=1 Tax=Wolbachia endosymbiont of Ctenocephalides felis wCfeT TaxID=2732593 RepID=UPI001446E435|nr:dephospho-CoA kinase [Wolbachia endosymbiont of Ctenocephalides felis wCfeT]